MKSNYPAKANAYPTIISLLISVLAVIIFFSLYNTESKTNFEDLALGKQTQSYYARIGENQIHCKDMSDIEKCIQGFRRVNLEHSALWLGNSQLHAINQLKSGQKTAAFHLHQKLKKNKIYLFTLSQPNANLQEHYVLFEYIKKQLPVQFLILPICFDDTRDIGLRHSIVDALKNPDVINELKKTDAGNQILLHNHLTSNGSDDLEGVKDSLQEYSEKYLNQFLKKNLDAWDNRPEFRGRVYNYLYTTRNWLFNIQPTSKRRKIIGRYTSNMAALSLILESAKKSNIKVLLYIPPIRSDVDIPYDENEYRQFKIELLTISQKYRFNFENLEDLVPGKYWGYKDSTSVDGQPELDFMHFNSTGHTILADTLYSITKKQIPVIK